MVLRLCDVFPSLCYIISLMLLLLFKPVFRAKPWQKVNKEI